MAAVLVVFAAIAAALPSGRTQMIVQGVSLAAANVAAVAIAAVGVARTRGADRRWRLAVGVVLLSCLAGAVEWIAHYPLLKLPKVSLTPLHLLYLPVLLLIVWGLLLIPASRDASRGPPGVDGAQQRHSTLLIALDALVIVTSMLLISWVGALQEVAQGHLTDQQIVTGLTFPLSGILGLTVLLLRVTFRPPRNVASVAAIAAGLIALSAPTMALLPLAVSGEAPLESTARYWTGLAVGPLLVALGLAVPDRQPAVQPASGAEGDPLAHPLLGVGRTRVQAYLPYLPLAVASVMILVLAARGQALGGVTLFLALGLAALVTVRQLIMVAQNTRLVASVQAAQGWLRHQAFHDALTGLPNRALFTRELDRVARAHQSDGRPVIVLFCDLDDFKI
ncbi:MAG: diguanylate cyclase, partial [Frankia sp.]|nr:diguanylate cyclase [Frankia sp.]